VASRLRFSGDLVRGASRSRATFSSRSTGSPAPPSSTRSFFDADRDRVRLSIGYSDEVSVFLNGQILDRVSRPRAQSLRDPAFLGIVNPENDTFYLPLKRDATRCRSASASSAAGGASSAASRTTRHR
jgi:hypothetical protein